MRSKQSYLDAFNARKLSRRTLKHVPAIVGLARKARRRRNLDKAGWPCYAASSLTARLTWESEQQKRKEYPEAKRARHDRVFRKKFLKRLRERKRTLLREPARNCRTVTAWALKHAKRDRELQEIIRQRNIVLAPASRELVPITERPNWVYVPGDDRHDIAQIAEAQGLQVLRRAKHWRCCATLKPSSCAHAPGASRRINKRWSTVRYAINDTYLRFFAVVKTPQELEVVVHETIRSHTLPDGFVWDIDRNGLRILRADGADYHLTGQDLAHVIVDTLLFRLNTNAQIRRDAELRAKADRVAFMADKAGVWVCAADSLRAGNCLAGTEAFAHRHNIDTTRHYPAKTLLDMANGDAGRVRLAISAASLRHKRELERGFSILEDHVLAR